MTLCKACSFSSTDPSNFARHLKTKKHAKNTAKMLQQAKQPGSQSTQVDTDKTCKLCNKVFNYKHHRQRHESICKQPPPPQVETFASITIRDLTLKNETNALILIRELMDKNEKLTEKLDKYDKCSLQNMINTTNNNSHNTTNNINNTNNITNITIDANYIKKNFLTTESFFELMKPPLTADEKLLIAEIDPHYTNPAATSIQIMNNRCFKDRHPHKYPVYCTDESRNKYIAKEKNGWSNVSLLRILSTLDIIAPEYIEQLKAAENGRDTDKYSGISIGLTTFGNTKKQTKLMQTKLHHKMKTNNIGHNVRMYNKAIGAIDSDESEDITVYNSVYNSELSDDDDTMYNSNLSDYDNDTIYNSDLSDDVNSTTPVHPKDKKVINTSIKSRYYNQDDILSDLDSDSEILSYRARRYKC